jgi:hypothetical protein
MPGQPLLIELNDHLKNFLKLQSNSHVLWNVRWPKILYARPSPYKKIHN